MLPSAAIKASARFPAERKTNGAFATLHFTRLQDQYCNVAKAGGWSVAHAGVPYCYFWDRDNYFMPGMETGQHGAIRGHGEAASVDCYFLLGLFAV